LNVVLISVSSVYILPLLYLRVLVRRTWPSPIRYSEVSTVAIGPKSILLPYWDRSYKDLSLCRSSPKSMNFGLDLENTGSTVWSTPDDETSLKRWQFNTSEKSCQTEDGIWHDDAEALLTKLDGIESLILSLQSKTNWWSWIKRIFI
jgi:hypothetical protein